MPKPTKEQIAAVAHILATDWDADGAKALRARDAYTEWATGIADMIVHEPPPDTLPKYLGVLEEQLGVTPSSDTDRARLAARLDNH